MLLVRGSRCSTKTHLVFILPSEIATSSTDVWECFNSRIKIASGPFMPLKISWMPSISGVDHGSTAAVEDLKVVKLMVAAAFP